MNIEAIKQALEALEWNLPLIEDFGDKEQLHRQHQAITSLRQAIAEAEKQEPVAWRGYNWSHSPDDWVYRDFDDPILDGKGNNVGQPLYTSPPKQEPCPYVVSTKEGTNHCALSHREPLTDEQIYGMYNEPRSDAEMIEFARAIEAAHGIGEKNG